MKNLIYEIITAIMYLSLLYGTGAGFILIHDAIKKETLTQVSKGLGATEDLSNALSKE